MGYQSYTVVLDTLHLNYGTVNVLPLRVVSGVVEIKGIELKFLQTETLQLLLLTFVLCPVSLRLCIPLTVTELLFI